MPESKKAESYTTDAAPSEDELLMALCAILYCIGRISYVVSDGVRWARRYGRISPWVRQVVIRKIETTMGESSYVVGQEWRAVLAEFKDLEAARAK